MSKVPVAVALMLEAPPGLILELAGCTLMQAAAAGRVGICSGYVHSNGLCQQATWLWCIF